MSGRGKSPYKSGDSAKRAAGATIRALAGAPVNVAFGAAVYGTGPHFGGAQITTHKGQVTATLHWAFQDTASNAVTLRGQGDSAGFHQRYSDPAITARHRPADPAAAALFDMMERARYESAGGRDFPGAGMNMQDHMMQACANTQVNPNLPFGRDTTAQLLYFMGRRIMGGHPPPPGFQPAVDRLQGMLRGMMGPEPLARMKDLMDDQDAFAAHVRQFIAILDFKDTPAPQQQPQPEAGSKPAPGKKPATGERPDAAREHARAGDREAPPDAPVHDRPAPAADKAATTTRPDPAPGQTDKIMAAVPAGAAPRPVSPAADRTGDYRAYTTGYDEIIRAEKLAPRPENVAAARRRMDQLWEQNRHVIGRLANRLQRKLMARAVSPVRCEQDLEDGVLDPSRLARGIIDPLTPLMYRRETEIDVRDTVVTLLIDNSGSMRGGPIMTAAVSAEILASTLERCGVRVEILGFTTSRWKGGRSYEKWMTDGRPDEPGRLNDLRHIIYKPADMPYRHARRNMAIMAGAEEILKENIDGEALEWAYARLLARPEKRRILLMISDGCPADDATATRNARAANYLPAHLRAVVSRIEGEGRVELFAIGVGHNIAQYFRNSVRIPGMESLGETLLSEADRLFDRKPPRHDRTPRRAPR